MSGDTHATTLLPPIPSEDFFSNYFGHPAHHLEDLVQHKPHDIPTIYFVGDSTLDNKYWLPNHRECHPSPYISSRLTSISSDSLPMLSRDVAYWLSSLYENDEYLVINCAVEQTLLRTRLKQSNSFSMNVPHDDIVRRYITSHDILIVSIGGNDVALSPTLSTAFSVLMNVLISSNLGMKNLIHLFRDGIQQYVSSLLEQTKPRIIVICMLYYPDENSSAPSWASLILRLLGYNSKPEKLKGAIDRVFEQAVSQVRIEGCQVVFAPFYRVLDGKNTQHYVERVEPSEEGGKAMACLLKQVIDQALVLK